MYDLSGELTVTLITNWRLQKLGSSQTNNSMATGVTTQPRFRMETACLCLTNGPSSTYLSTQTFKRVKPQAATSGGLPNWGPPQGKNTYIHPFVGPARGVKKTDNPHIKKDSSPLSVFMLFFIQIFHLLVEQTNIYYQQHLDGQAGPSRWLPDIMFWTWRLSLP